MLCINIETVLNGDVTIEQLERERIEINIQLNDVKSKHNYLLLVFGESSKYDLEFYMKIHEEYSNVNKAIDTFIHSKSSRKDASPSPYY